MKSSQHRYRSSLRNKVTSNDPIKVRINTSLIKKGKKPSLSDPPSEDTHGSVGTKRKAKGFGLMEN
jgi:hypothetical protein